MAEPDTKKAKFATPVLYSYFRSSCSWRVRIALNLKGIECDFRFVHLLNGGGEQHQATYTALNPMHQVPTLVIDGHTLCQSMAILHYLDETRPDHPLLPSDAFERARCRQICDIIASDTQPVQNLRVLNKHAGDDAAKKAEWARFWIDNSFQGLEAVLAASTGSGPYCCGDVVTMADCCLVPQVFNAQRFDCDLSPYPKVMAIHEACMKLPAVIAAQPSAQPDATP